MLHSVVFLLYVEGGVGLGGGGMMDYIFGGSLQFGVPSLRGWRSWQEQVCVARGLNDLRLMDLRHLFGDS